MAWECTRSTFAGRLYEEGVIYDSIGKADMKYFKEVKGKDIPVVETGDSDPGESPGGAPAPAGDGDDLVADLKAALDELGAEYPADAGAEELQELLSAAQMAALS